MGGEVSRLFVSTRASIAPHINIEAPQYRPGPDVGLSSDPSLWPAAARDLSWASLCGPAAQDLRSGHVGVLGDRGYHGTLPIR